MHYLLLLSGFSWVHFWVTVNWMCSCLTNNVTQMKESKTPAVFFFFVGAQSPFQSDLWLFCVTTLLFFCFLKQMKFPFAETTVVVFNLPCLPNVWGVWAGHRPGVMEEMKVLQTLYPRYHNTQTQPCTCTQSPVRRRHRKDTVFINKQFPQPSMVQKRKM